VAGRTLVLQSAGVGLAGSECVSVVLGPGGGDGDGGSGVLTIRPTTVRL
jgi:hypothetical protein